MIGMDVGGTRLKCGAVTRDGCLSAAHAVPTGFAMAPEALLQAMTAEVERIEQVQGHIAKGIALGFPGAVDPLKGVVMLPGKLRVEGFPMVPRLEAATGIPVIADNDGRLSILAEVHYGKARGYKWAVAITLGTGVGSGVMLDGHVLRDPRLQFGTQASHIVQQAHSDRLCITRARGTANILCSATALALAVRDGLMRGLPSLLNEMYFQNPHNVDFEAVIAGVAQGDALCWDAIVHWRTQLGWFLVSVVHMYSPEIIILSGGATHAAPYFLDDVREHVNRHVFRYPPGDEIHIELSSLATYTGVLGAAALAWEEADRRQAS